MRVIHEEILTGTTASGNFSINTSKHIYGLLREIIIKPLSSTTTFDFNILNISSLIMYEETNLTGETGIEIALPIKGINTFSIANASKDELFTIQLSISEI